MINNKLKCGKSDAEMFTFSIEYDVFDSNYSSFHTLIEMCLKLTTVWPRQSRNRRKNRKKNVIVCIYGSRLHFRMNSFQHFSIEANGKYYHLLIWIDVFPETLFRCRKDEKSICLNNTWCLHTFLPKRNKFQGSGMNRYCSIALSNFVW